MSQRGDHIFVTTETNVNSGSGIIIDSHVLSTTKTSRTINNLNNLTLLNSTGNDTCGTVTVRATLTTPNPSYHLTSFRVYFDKQYTSLPTIMISPFNNRTATSGVYVDDTATTNSYFTIVFQTITDVVNEYKINYFVIGTQ